MSNICVEHSDINYCDTYVRPTFFLLSVLVIVIAGFPLFDHYYFKVLHKVDGGMDEILYNLSQLSKVTEDLSASQKKIEEQFEDVLAKGIEENMKQICIIKRELQETGKRIEEMIYRELQKYDADKTAMPDFALENTGGSVITTRGTQTYEHVPASIMGFPICAQKNLPNSMIQANVLPGECWSFHGSSGSAAVRLITEIYVTAVTLEHIPESLSPTGERSSAPKDFSIWGITSLKSDEDSFCFGQFIYDLSGPPVQTFKVKYHSPKPYSLTELRVHSNHGNPNYTCVYRLRVHGNLKETTCGAF